jgi:hypothetical protein
LDSFAWERRLETPSEGFLLFFWKEREGSRPPSPIPPEGGKSSSQKSSIFEKLKLDNPKLDNTK